MNILKDNKKLILCLCIACALYLPSPPAAHAQTADSLFNVCVILPGMTQSIDIRQAALFPFGCPQFFVAVMGKGTLGISLKKDDVAGDLIFMTGLASSSAGTIPIYRLGVSKGMIDQILEIGDSNQPYGFVWIYCGVAYSGSIPVFASQLRLSLAP
jgi:hypothetical protein